MAAAKKIRIREVAPRDGFQSWPEFVPTEQKLEVIRLLVAAGVREMETTSFVSPKAIPQMRDAAEVLAAVPRGGCIHGPLVPNLKGAVLALESGADQLVVVISVSDAHNLANVRRTVKESLADLKAIFELAHARGKPVAGAMAVAFGCPYQGDVPEDDVYRLAEAYISGGAASIILADTTGMATPPRVVRLVQGFARRFPGVPYSLHLHNNRGTAMANLYAALEAGADAFDAALGRGAGDEHDAPAGADRVGPARQDHRRQRRVGDRDRARRRGRVTLRVGDRQLDSVVPRDEEAVLRRDRVDREGVLEVPQVGRNRIVARRRVAGVEIHVRIEAGRGGAAGAAAGAGASGAAGGGEGTGDPPGRGKGSIEGKSEAEGGCAGSAAAAGEVAGAEGLMGVNLFKERQPGFDIQEKINEPGTRDFCF